MNTEESKKVSIFGVHIYNIIKQYYKKSYSENVIKIIYTHK